MITASLTPDTTVLLVVDLQQKLLAAMHDSAACMEAARRMIEAAKVLGVPTAATEQYPQGLGRSCETIAASLGGAPVVEKMRFSACVDAITAWLTQLARPNVIVVGIETHVCVRQTVQDLLRGGFVPFVCADAVSSRRPLDRDVALDQMRQSGAVVTTTESVIFELLGEAGSDQFKRILKIVK